MTVVVVPPPPLAPHPPRPLTNRAVTDADAVQGTKRASAAPAAPVVVAVAVVAEAAVVAAASPHDTTSPSAAEAAAAVSVDVDDAPGARIGRSPVTTPVAVSVGGACRRHGNGQAPLRP